MIVVKTQTFSTYFRKMHIADLYNDHSKLVYNLALQYTQNTEDAEEIVQDVFVKVFKKFDTFEHQAHVQTWIYRITINTSLDFLKAKKAQKRFAIFSRDEKVIERLSNFSHPGVELENRESFKELFRHINSLPEQQRTILILLKIEQKSQKEVAEILKISPKAIESAFQRAKYNLKKMINQSKENE